MKLQMFLPEQQLVEPRWMTGPRSKKDFIAKAEWFWQLFYLPDGAKWDGLQLVLEGKPSCTPTEAADLVPNYWLADGTSRAQHQQKVTLRVASCNALTLKGTSSQDERGGHGPTRLRSMLRQSSEAGVHIVAFQETRLRRLQRLLDPDYFLIHSPATPAGHLGILIGLHKKLTIATDEFGHETQFKENCHPSNPKEPDPSATDFELPLPPDCVPCTSPRAEPRHYWLILDGTQWQYPSEVCEVAATAVN